MELKAILLNKDLYIKNKDFFTKEVKILECIYKRIFCVIEIAKQIIEAEENDAKVVVSGQYNDIIISELAKKLSNRTIEKADSFMAKSMQMDLDIYGMVKLLNNFDDKNQNNNDTFNNIPAHKKSKNL
ncbi:UNVERIFIED_CONTAM: hypothetical protein O8I53_08690 [Campylobacter lari]